MKVAGACDEKDTRHRGLIGAFASTTRDMVRLPFAWPPPSSLIDGAVGNEDHVAQATLVYWGYNPRGEGNGAGVGVA